MQEQNSLPGKTNLLLAKKAKAICVAYPNMDVFFSKEKIHLTGNPVRSDILEIDEKDFLTWLNKRKIQAGKEVMLKPVIFVEAQKSFQTHHRL